MEDKRLSVRLELIVTNADGKETLGANLRFGEVKEDHILIYESVIDKHINNAKTELAALQKAGKF